MKNIFKILIAVAIILILTLLFICNGSSEKENFDDVDSLKSVIESPMSNINIAYDIYSINPQKDTVLTHYTGSQISIPQNAFLDKDGNVITENVKLKYREFSNALDIYIGGVPMEYDSAGGSMVFETAGMIEINAFSKRKAVFVNPENKIEVKMVSSTPDNRFNLYQLDTLNGKWTNVGKDSIIQDDYNTEIADLPIIPNPPKKAGQFSFSIGDNTGNYPELAAYKNVMFEPIKGKHCGFNSTEINVKELTSGKYKVTFIVKYYKKVIKENSCTCYLAFKDGPDFDNAMTVYQKKYGHLISKRKRMKAKIDAAWEKYRKQVEIYNKAVEVYNFQFLDTDKKILRALRVNSFGFINCDYPLSYPNGAELIASFQDSTQNILQLKSIVLIEKGRNALFRYKKVVKFDPSKENILWGITDENKLAVFNSEDFKTIIDTTGKYTFTMQVQNKKINTYNDVIKALF